MQQGTIKWLDKEARSMLGIVKQSYLDVVDNLDQNDLWTDDKRSEQTIVESRIKSLEILCSMLLMELDGYDPDGNVEETEQAILVDCGSFNELYNETFNHIDNLDENV